MTSRAWTEKPRQVFLFERNITADRLVCVREGVNLSLDAVAERLSRVRSFDEDGPRMTTQRSQIFRAFARGEPIAQIAESCGLSYDKAWSHLRRAVAELDRKNPSELDTIRWQQYLALMRVVDQAFAAFERSAEEGVSEVTSQTIESVDDSGNLGVKGKSVTHRVRKDAGDIRYLEVAMKALSEIRDLFKIGPESESSLRAEAPKRGLALGAALRGGSIRLPTRWKSEPLEEDLPFGDSAASNSEAKLVGGKAG